MKQAEPAETEMRYASSKVWSNHERSGEKIIDIQREPQFLAFARFKNELGGEERIKLGGGPGQANTVYPFPHSVNVWLWDNQHISTRR